MDKELRILMLEDSTEDAELIERELHEAGISFTARRVQTKHAFTQAIRSFQPDLILSDYKLPSFDGLSALQIAKNGYPNIPFIFVSGAIGEEFAIEILKKGATDYVLKSNLSRLGPVIGRSLHDIQQAIRKMQLEKQLLESEEKFRLLAEQSPNMIFINKNERIAYANKRCEEVMGYSRDELYSKAFNFVNLLAPESIKSVKTAFVQHTGGTDVEPREYTLVTKLKEKIDAIITTKLIDYEGEKAILGIITDITEWRRAEQALRASEAKFRRFFENEPEYCYMISPDGAIFDVNIAALKALGYTKEELIGKPLKTIYAPESITRMQELFKKWKKSSTIRDEEMIIITKGGEKRTVLLSITRIFDKDGGILHSISVQKDITDRKQAEKALSQSEERYRDLTQSITDVFFALSQDLHHTYCNKPWEMLTGTPAGYAIGKTISEVFPDNFEMQRAADEFKKVLRSKSPKTFEHEFRFNEKRLEFEIRVYPTKDGISVFAHDITVRKQLQQQLLHSQKMEAIGRLTGGIAHEFNNMLTALEGYSELLANNLGQKDPNQEFVQKIRKVVARSTILSRQLLAFSHKQELNFEIINLNKLVEEMEKLLRKVIGVDITLITDLDPTLEYISADPGQIEQVIMNLAVNSVDAMPNGGVLSIITEMSSVTESKIQSLGENRPGKFARIMISDTGIGMDETTKAQIFDPFFSTKEKEKGTGLGLSTVYGIVKQHNGWITVDSSPGTGTSFFICFPVVEKKPTAKATASKPLANLQGSGERILLVEDEPEVREFLTRALRQSGYELLEANDANQAFSILEMEKGNVDLVFSDVVLPDLNGIDLVQQIVAENPGIKVVLNSGYMDEKIQISEIRKKGFLFLQKPYRLAELLSTVKKALKS